MSSSNSNSSKNKFNPKIKIFKITPFQTNHTTANSSNKNTLILNTYKEDFYTKDKIQYFLSDVNLKNRKINSLQKNKKVPNNNYIKSKSNPNSKNKIQKSKPKIIDNSNKNIKTQNLCYSRTRPNSKEKNTKVKSKIIRFNEISSSNNNQTKKIKLLNDILFKRNRNESFKKEENKKFEIKFINKENKTKLNISDDKYIDSLKNNFHKNVTKKFTSRNCDLKLQSSSLKNINTKYNSKTNKENICCNSSKNNKFSEHKYKTTKISNSNSKSKNKINKTVYYKKRMEDSFKLMNIKSTYCNQPKNKINNHNYLVNLILKNKRFDLDEKGQGNKNVKIMDKKSPSKSTKPKNKKINCLIDNEWTVKINNKFSEENNEYNIKKSVINKNDMNKNNKITNNNKKPEKMKLNNDRKNKKFTKQINKRENEINIKRYSENKETNKKLKDISKKDNSFNIIENLSKQDLKEKRDLDTKINNIRINEFNVKKPKEVNMKFTLLKSKNKNEESTEEINKSKIILGTIEGYKDIIEEDKLNNENFQKDNSINIFESNTLDNNTLIRKKNKNIINFNIIEPKDSKDFNKKNNGVDELEISKYNCTNGFILNESEVKSILKYVYDENDINDLSTTILNKNTIYTNNILLPYHVNMISITKKFDNKTKKYILNDNINNDKILLITDKLSVFKYQKIHKNKSINRQEIIRNTTKNKFNNKKQNNNVIQNKCNIFIHGNDKMCLIF